MPPPLKFACPMPPAEVTLPFPVIGEDGLLDLSGGIPTDVAAFVQSWVVQLIRLEIANPAAAAQLRAVFGFDPNVSLFNNDAWIH